MTRPGKMEWRNGMLAGYGRGGFEAREPGILDDLRARPDWPTFERELRSAFLAAEVLYL